MLGELKALLGPKRKTSTAKQQSGDAAEALAESFLTKQGLTLVTRNFSCRFGEIDLIMRQQHTLVFTEVRYRSALKRNGSVETNFGGALESISPIKQRKIIRTAQFYLTTLADVPECRFDVVLLDKLDAANIEWIRAAFDASG